MSIRRQSELVLILGGGRLTDTTQPLNNEIEITGRRCVGRARTGRLQNDALSDRSVNSTEMNRLYFNLQILLYR